jgi:hypothetical protein
MISEKGLMRNIISKLAINRRNLSPMIKIKE